MSDGIDGIRSSDSTLILSSVNVDGVGVSLGPHDALLGSELRMIAAPAGWYASRRLSVEDMRTLRAELTRRLEEQAPKEASDG